MRFEPVCIALWVTIALVNLIGFLTVRADKRTAQSRQARKQGKARVPERMFWVLALFGGWPATAMGFLVWNHKTRKFGFLAGFAGAAIIGTAALAGWFMVLGCLGP